VTVGEQPLVARVDQAKLARVRRLGTGAVLALPALALVVLVLVLLMDSRARLIWLAAIFCGLLLVAALQAFLRVRAVKRVADADGVAFAVDYSGVYVGRFAQTIPWSEITGIVHWDSSDKVAAAGRRRLLGFTARFVANTGGHAHHLTFGIRDGQALIDAAPSSPRPPITLHKQGRGRLILLSDTAVSAEDNLALLDQLRRYAVARGISFTRVTGVLDWGSAVEALDTQP
jgi:hypothetical protein